MAKQDRDKDKKRLWLQRGDKHDDDIKGVKVKGKDKRWLTPRRSRRIKRNHFIKMDLNDAWFGEFGQYLTRW